MKTLFFVFVFSSIPALAFGHPGHGTTDPSSWRHYLTEPVHASVLASALVLFVTSVLEVRRRRAMTSRT